MTPRSCTGSCGRIAETLVYGSGRSDHLEDQTIRMVGPSGWLDHREDQAIWKVRAYCLFFLLEFMFKLAIFAN
jgi:hypothetical protein